MRMPLLAVIAVVAVVVACTPAPQRAEPARTPARSAVPVLGPVARPVLPDPRVGVLFLDSGDVHTCTASVLDSAAGDLILTAAHCLVGGVETTFVAGFDDHAGPGEVWQLGPVYLDSRWISDQDPAADYAIARVSRAEGGSVEGRAGGGFALGATPAAGTPVTVTGYGMGAGDGPIGCRSAVSPPMLGFPSFECVGMVAGVSGSPWTSGSTVLGLVGGLDGGGCDDDISYSPPFDDHLRRLLARAQAGGAGDWPPTDFEDDC